MSTCRTILSSKINDLKVKPVPRGFGKGPLEIALGLNDVLSRGEAPPLGAAMNVGVDRKGGMIKGLGHDHGGGLMTDAGERFERRK